MEAAVLGGPEKGLLGPLFLLAPLALLALRHPRGRRLLPAAAVAYFAFGVIPALPFLALAMAVALAPSRGVVPLLAAAQVFFCFPFVVPVYCHWQAWRLTEVPWMEALRRVPAEPYLAARLPGYGPARLVEQAVPAGAKVFAFARVTPAYTEREVVTDARLGDALRTAFTPALQPTVQWRYSFPRREVRSLRITGDAAVTEFRVLLDGAEVPRRPDWRLRARPDVFAAALAFDNNYATALAGRRAGGGLPQSADGGRRCARVPARPGRAVPRGRRRAGAHRGAALRPTCAKRRWRS